jgi:hypothetical protein
MKTRGWEISNYLGGFLLGCGTFRANPTKIAFYHVRQKVGFDVTLVTRIGLAFTVFVEYLLMPWAFSQGARFQVFNYPMPEVEGLTMIAGVAFFAFGVAPLFLGHELFAKWEGLEKLGDSYRQRYTEVAGTTLVLCWFLAMGGGDLMDFVVIPSFVLSLYIRDVLKDGMNFNVHPRRKWAEKLKRALKRVDIPSESFMVTFLNSSSSPDVMFQAMILLPIAAFLALNTRLYTLGDPLESLSLVLWTIPVIVAYLGIRKKTKRPGCFIAVMLLSLAVVFTVLLPSSVPMFKHGLLSLGTDASMGLFNLLILIVAAYPMFLSTFTLKRAQSHLRLPRVKKLWRLGEALVIVPIAILYIIRGARRELEFLLPLVFVGVILEFIVFETTLHYIIKAFEARMEERKASQETEILTPRSPIAVSKRRLAFEAFFLQMIMPILILIVISLT